MRRRRKTWAFLIGLALCFFVASMAEAVQVVQIDQPKVRLSILPGNNETGVIKVSNPSSEPKNIKVYLSDWYYIPGGDGSKEFKPAGTTKLSAAGWINFSPAEFTVPPHGIKNVNYTVRVPREARGGHYAILFFEGLLGEPAEITEGVVVPVAVRIGSLFYIEAEGTVDRDVRLENIDISRAFKNKLLKIEADLANQGNVDVTASGTFYIIDGEGMVYGRGKFNQVYTLPDDSARLRASYDKSIPPGSYDLIITLETGSTSAPFIRELEVGIGSNGEILDFRVKD